MKAPEGVEIFDFARVPSRPTRTRPLARLGADVVEVERPGVECAPGTRNQTMYQR